MQQKIVKIKDQINGIIALHKEPKRIVSLVPSQTEMLANLGLEKQLVGITKFCIHPDNLRKTKTVVGGTKQVNYSKIKALNPDFILCNKEENTAKMVEILKTIAPTYVSDILNLKDFYRFSNDLGKIFTSNPNFFNLIKQLKEKETDFRKHLQITTIKTTKVAYLIWADPYMAVGKHTFIDSMLQLNGWQNIFASKERYPVISLEQLKEADYVLLSSEPFPFKEKHFNEIAKKTQAKIISVDGEMFSWFGTRLLKAFDYFKVLRNLKF